MSDLFPDPVRPTTWVKCITLWRPWADWVILGWKPIETRKHRRFQSLGTEPTILGIHAADKWDKGAIDAARPWLTEEQIHLTEAMRSQKERAGHLLGTVAVTSFRQLTADDEPLALIECQSIIRYGLFLANPRPLPEPFRVTGKRGLFNVQIQSSHLTTLK